MKKTIRETREMMNKINEFLSENAIQGTAERAAKEFLAKYKIELANKFGSRWRTKGGEWALNSNNMEWIHDLVWQFATDEFPEHMGDEERSEKFVQSVMEYI